MKNDKEYARSILNSATTILLIDWPHVNLPRSLVEKGFSVFCHSPAGFTRATVTTETGSGGKVRVMPPETDRNDYLIFTPIDTVPVNIDIVNIFRPEAEHSEIIKKIALPLNAKVIWLQPPVTSAETEVLAGTHGLKFVEGVNIMDL